MGLKKATCKLNIRLESCNSLFHITIISIIHNYLSLLIVIKKYNLYGTFVLIFTLLKCFNLDPI